MLLVLIMIEDIILLLYVKFYLYSILAAVRIFFCYAYQEIKFFINAFVRFEIVLMNI